MIDETAVGANGLRPPPHCVPHRMQCNSGRSASILYHFSEKALHLGMGKRRLPLHINFHLLH